MTNIAVIVGSIRKESINQKYIEDVEKLLSEDISFHYASIDLPLYNQDLEADFPQAALDFKKFIEDADGVIVVTPEYNRGIPGPLKNALDWASRPWGSNSFNGKPSAIIGVSGALATTQAQQQLRNVLVYLNTHVMGQPEMYINRSFAYGEDGMLTTQAQDEAKAFITTFTKHVARLK